MLTQVARFTCYWTFWSIPVLLVLAFIIPILTRKRSLAGAHRYNRMPVLCRALSAVLALIFFIGFQPLELLAQEADLYSQLEAQDWGRNGSVTNYEYDLNGSMIRKVMTDSNQTIDETFKYNLENRLVKHVKTTDLTTSEDKTIATTTYLYNHEGIKVSKSSEIKSVNEATNAETILSTSSESYLIDAYNLTGYAQVLEEAKDSGVVTSYTIGDDVLAQTKGALPSSYLLYDGHGSTRQLTDTLGAVTGEYSYDSYGLMLGEQAGNQQEQATKLLYCGEAFDTSLQQYNLRARHYNPSNGRFNRLDPFSGNRFDPQSLHKYAYCHSDPVNGVDPSGEVIMVMMAFGLRSAWQKSASLRATFAYKVAQVQTAIISMFVQFRSAIGQAIRIAMRYVQAAPGKIVDIGYKLANLSNKYYTQAQVFTGNAFLSDNAVLSFVRGVLMGYSSGYTNEPTNAFTRAEMWGTRIGALINAWETKMGG